MREAGVGGRVGGPCGVGAAEEQAWNEAALAQPVHTPAWRLWHYREAAVVLGCSQRPWAASAAANDRIEVLVRDSGGGAVLVGPWMLGLSVVLPAALPLVAAGALPSYRWLGVAIAAAVRDIGIAASPWPPQASGDGRAGASAGPDWACFGALSPWEVLARGRKIAGLAQRRRRQGVLLVAGVLLRPPPWAMLCERLGQARSHAQRLALASTSCAQEGVQAAEAQLAHALERSLQAALQAAPMWATAA